jgi:hypothetical protein
VTTTCVLVAARTVAAVPLNGTVGAAGVTQENGLLYETVAQLEADLQR